MKKSSLPLNIALLAGLVIAALGVTFWLDNATPTASKAAPGIAVQLPEFSFITLDGKKHSSLDFKNKIIVLNFWATWCTPCIKEFPDLIKIADAHERDLVLIALSSDMDETAIKNFGKRAKLDWDKKNIFIALDRNDVTGKLFGATGLPETFIFDANGTLHTKLIGAEWSVSEFENILETIN